MKPKALNHPMPTSQQAKGEHHLSEGHKEGAKPGVQWGSEGAPSGVPTQAGIANPLSTTADLRDDLSNPES